MTSRKEQHEAFVSNLNGGPLKEIFAVSAASALFFVVAAAVRRLLPRFPLVVDFVFAVVPNVVLVTLWSDRAFLLLFLLLLILPALCLLPAGPPRSLHDSRGHPACVSCFRGLMLCCTSLCILAVDFPAFPRRFAKAETFGTGLMDVGVGSFALALGLVSREARGLQSRVGATLRGTVAPLFLLGALRTLSVKATGYQEHVTEYGVHWNFFLTLACSKLLVLLLHTSSNGRVPLLVMAVAVSLLQDVQLRLGGAHWVLDADRSDFLSANKEGIVSLSAFAALELWGAWIGAHVHDALRPGHRNRDLVFRLILPLLAIFALSISLQLILGPTSRRLGNSSYMAWMVANSTMTLLIFLVGQLLLKHETGPGLPSLLGSSDLLGLLNRSSLFHFLAANLATGFVNFSVNTLIISDTAAVGILCAYQLLLVAIVRAYEASPIRSWPF